jgi:hypothetical protein
MTSYRWLGGLLLFASTRSVAQNPPATTLGGTWVVDISLDSASPSRPAPRARNIRGRLLFSDISESAAFGYSSPSNALFGRSTLDFTPLFGDRIAPSISSTVFGPTDSAFASEVVAEVSASGLVGVQLIPRISHGGATLSGRITGGDSVEGVWEERAYCCGARGHFTMTRVDRRLPTLALPPRPKPAPPLDTTQLGRVRVRVWEQSSQRYIRLSHSLRLPNGSWKSAYHTGEGGDGWGRGFWLPPGEYRIEFKDFPCGSKTWFLATPLERAFVVNIGSVTSVDIVVNLREQDAKKSYDNQAANRCTI